VRLDIRYRCSFEYDALVRESQNELRACPTSDERQTLLGYRVSTYPASRVVSFTDYLGTRVDAFGVREPHIFLEVVADATVEMTPAPLVTTTASFDWLRDTSFVDEHHEYLERTAHADWDGTLAEEAFRQVELAGADVVSVVLAIHRRVGSLLRYQPGASYVGMPLSDLISRGEGVCQDYAHMAIAMCRSVGIPSRYVSGYLFTQSDATGEDSDEDVVEVQTHAWFEAAVPRMGWMALDPTNRQEVGMRHVKIGHGRDYDDVQPLRGSYTGPPTANLDVSVEMRRLTGSIGPTHQQQLALAQQQADYQQQVQHLVQQQQQQ
jgi:transglutaminase-like putative cysteine protease